LSASIQSVTTARITPEFFQAGQGVRVTSRALVIVALALSILIGFGFRVTQLGAESVSEDELNKLRAVADYRANGITASNGEHPMLMKASQTLSIIVFEKWNALFAPSSAWQVSTESALRFPCALLGALTSLLLFLVVSELFGTEIALITAVLWAFDPSAIGFNRIAKEDTFLLFFFLLANVFWLRGQRVAEQGTGKPNIYYWTSGALFGAMLASKYLPHLLAISAGYYYIFQGIPATRWRLGKIKWLVFLIVMGVAFVICNPAILLPETWKAMLSFAGEKRIAHDSYEFMGQLYRNQFSLWFKGVPWYFYYVFSAVKLPVTTVLAAVIGLPLLFRKKMGDGRYLILFWLLFWFMPFSVLGGKFTRYFTVGLPVVLIAAAIGWHAIAQWISKFATEIFKSESSKSFVYASVCIFALLIPLIASASVAPHYRLYTNVLGGGWSKTGFYFPHDEFYDASTREAARFIAANAKPNARVANETPYLYDYYFKQAGRDDLRSVLLSDKEDVKKLETGDVVIVARGRRYYSNEKAVAALENAMQPTTTISLGIVPSARIFLLNKIAQEAIIETVK
jgi:4-amino-4-deoxy-L-arabinose transferase-like glycosyltransferase